MSTCIRKPGSQWTMCRCEPCKADMARKSKLRRNGLPVTTDQRAAALRRVQTWDQRGYSARVIAEMTGLADRTIMPMIYAIRDGRTHRITHATAAKIMAAPAHPIDSGGWVPSIGTVRRLRALTVMGWSMSLLATRAGIEESTLHALRDPKHQHTRPRFANAVRAIYDELAMTPGPCRYAATRARRKGWEPPLAWDDATIDDPAATPDLGQREQRHGRQRLHIDDIDWFLDQEPSATSDRVGQRLGVQGSSVLRAAERAGRTDLLARFRRNAEVAA